MTDRTRRRVVAGVLGTLAAGLWPTVARPLPPLRIGLTAVFLDDQVGLMARWRSYLSTRLEHPVEFVQRRAYREIVEQLAQGRLDCAWLCGYPYLRHRDFLRLLAVPVYRGRPLYQSYLIVPARDSQTRGLADLAGKVFAYSDPDSNSGYLYVQHRLREAGLRAENHFRRTFFTWAHSKVVDAVRTRLADGGAVDGYVWDVLDTHRPEWTAQTRIVERSPEFGFPPVVAAAGADPVASAQLQQALLGMTGDEEGRALLRELHLDGFTLADAGLYSGIEAMLAAL